MFLVVGPSSPQHGALSLLRVNPSPTFAHALRDCYPHLQDEVMASLTLQLCPEDATTEEFFKGFDLQSFLGQVPRRDWVQSVRGFASPPSPPLEPPPSHSPPGEFQSGCLVRCRGFLFDVGVSCLMSGLLDLMSGFLAFVAWHFLELANFTYM